MHLSPKPGFFRTATLACMLAQALACGSADTVATSLPGAEPEPDERDAGPGLDAGTSAAADADASALAPSPSADADQCNEVDIRFESKVPAVFILVDRSSSMFERGLWEPLKKGVLSIVEQLDKDVRFGFASYTGAAGGVCPELSGSVSVKQDNFEAIRAAYDGIKAPTYKGETPTARALEEAANILGKEQEGTAKFILLVTDGEPDFCDDPNVTCARDAVVAAAQQAKAKGVGTFIFSIGGSVDRQHLQDVANAGTGQGVQDRNMAVFYQCGGGLAQYAAEPGNAPFYEPNVNDQQALVSTLSSVVAGVRSCVFELSGKLAIDPNAADLGVVEIDGTRIPFGGPDGYRMNSRTQLELVGRACERLRKPETKQVFIDFPCEAIILL